MDRQVDSRLHAVLSEQGWSPRIEHDPRMAMAEACLARRELQLRAAWQTYSGLTPGLVILSHPEVDDVDAMRTAMNRHVPDIPIWSAQNHSLEPLNDAARAAAQIQGEELTSVTQATDNPPALVFHPGDEQFSPEPLSREEVAMLLQEQKDFGAPTEEPDQP
tara:strand:- start:3452 stop:3937 length:486 start_codon:yes stop_codon:yes gene_type:complete